MNILQLVDTFLISFLVAYLFTPFVRILAVKSGYLDHPRDNKPHAHPTPLLGGISIVAAFIIAILTKSQVMALTEVRFMMLGIFILVVIGLIDDRMGMLPNVKLLGQFLAAMVAIKAGARINCIHNYYLSVIITYVWIMGITNSFNLLDNMNGLSAGIAGIAALFFGVISYMNGQTVVSALSFALAGSSFGFLRHNFPKASIFMGDCGSLVLGYVLSVLALLGTWKSESTATSIIIPILILGYPILDTTLVSVMRILERRSIFQGGMDHSSHRLALLGLKRYRTVLVIYTICVLLGITTVLITKRSFREGVILGIAAFISMAAFGIRLAFVDTKRFGRKKGINDDNR